jgi:broad specificity phosphatase PhoE
MQEIVSENDGKTVAIVTHGGPIKVILLGVLNMPLKDIGEIKVNVAGLSLIEYKNSKAGLQLLNEVPQSNG